LVDSRGAEVDSLDSALDFEMNSALLTR